VYPKISIVTVSYNQADYVEENIRSVIDQNYPNVEHIVIDAGSTDGTLDILARYDEQIDWTSEPDKGQSDGLNKGFRKASGDIIGWINSDDMLAPNALFRVANYFKDHPEEIAVVGDQEIIDAQGLPVSVTKSRAYSFEYLLNHAQATTQNSLFFKRSVLDKTGYLDESLHYVMDHDLFIRISQVRQIPYLPVTLAGYRLQPASKTSQGTYKFSLELLKVRKKYGGRYTSPGGLNDLYIIMTQPLRRWKWLRKTVRSIRGGTGPPASVE